MIAKFGNYLKIFTMKTSKKITSIGLLLLFVIAIAATSCTSNRKCNGSRGTRTPMGNM